MSSAGWAFGLVGLWFAVAVYRLERRMRREREQAIKEWLAKGNTYDARMAHQRARMLQFPAPKTLTAPCGHTIYATYGGKCQMPICAGDRQAKWFSLH